MFFLHKKTKFVYTLDFIHVPWSCQKMQYFDHDLYCKQMEHEISVANRQKNPRLWYLAVCIRRFVGSTNQACSSGFYFRIVWKSTERPCLLQNNFLSFLQGLRSLKKWLLQKVSMKNLDQKFKFFIKKWIFWCHNI